MACDVSPVAMFDLVMMMMKEKINITIISALQIFAQRKIWFYSQFIHFFDDDQVQIRIMIILFVMMMKKISGTDLISCEKKPKRCERRPGAYWDVGTCQCKGDFHSAKPNRLQSTAAEYCLFQEYMKTKQPSVTQVYLGSFAMQQCR